MKSPIGDPEDGAAFKIFVMVRRLLEKLLDCWGVVPFCLPEALFETAEAEEIGNTISIRSVVEKR